LKGIDDKKLKETLGQKKNKQKGKVMIIRFLPFKVPKNWPYTKWSWKHL
jgi:hypothetical protein